MTQRQSRFERKSEQSLRESAITLATKLGDPNTFPKEITFNTSQTVPIITNTFKIVREKALNLYQYDVTLEPEMINEKLRRHFVYSAICPNGGRMSESEEWRNIIYDGRAAIFSSNSQLDREVDVKAKEDKTVKVIIKKVAEIGEDKPEQLLQIFNIAFQSVYRSFNLECSGRKWIDPTQFTKISGNTLTIFRGYRPSISYLSNGLTYVLESTSRITRNDNLYNFYKSKRSRQRMFDTNEFVKLIQELEITTTHLRKPKKVIITGISQEATIHTTFKCRTNPKSQDEIDISYAQYYMDHYNKELPNDDILFTAKATTKNGGVINYPGSVLGISGITKYERTKRNLKNEIAKCSNLPIDQKCAKYREFVQRINSDPESSKFLKRWGFQIQDTKVLTGFRLDPPVLMDGKTTYTLDPNRPSYQGKLRNMKFLRKSTINGCILFVSYPGSEHAGQLQNALRDISRNLDFELTNLVPITTKGASADHYTRVIVDYIKENRQSPPTFVICVVPDTQKDRYDSIKSVLSSDLGIPSQIAIEGSLNPKLLMSVATNLVIQIGTKLNGALVKLSRKSISAEMKGTMLIGLSIASGKGRDPSSYVSGVATTDFDLSMYHSKSFGPHNEKIIPENFITDFIQSALQEYRNNTQEAPQRIIVYREGVSYGQMPDLKEQEVNAIASSVGSIPLTYIVCQKHANIAIMLNRDNHPENCKSGTVVTEGVSTAGVGEFFLISHAANQGVARPTRYTVIHQTPLEAWNNENLVRLTHYDTMVYPNWPGPIRVPTVLMLATKLAEFHREHLNGVSISETIQNLLHYI